LLSLLAQLAAAAFSRKAERRLVNTAMELLSNEDFVCKTLTIRILPRSSLYLDESTDFVRMKIFGRTLGKTPFTDLRGAFSRLMTDQKEAATLNTVDVCVVGS
jgi:hypothetical protein